MRSVKQTQATVRWSKYLQTHAKHAIEWKKVNCMTDERSNERMNERCMTIH